MKLRPVRVGDARASADFAWEQRLEDDRRALEKLAMDPWRTPEKVLTGHLCDQMADRAGDPRTPASPATA